jgi:hypothetical protein
MKSKQVSAPREPEKPRKKEKEQEMDTELREFKSRPAEERKE